MAVLLTFLLIALGSVALIGAVTGLVAVKRRPLRHLQETLQSRGAAGFVVQATGVDDLYLGLRLLGPSGEEAAHSLGRMFVLRVAPDAFEFWSPAKPTVPSFRLTTDDVSDVTETTVLLSGASRPAAALVLARTPEIKLPFIVISGRGSGLKPMTATETREFVSQVRRLAQSGSKSVERDPNKLS